ncbi:rho-related GTP-binding protein RhoU-like [Centroberyx affinis]|uniref:rho-related GTP-binding protein RhoU-like n=1 Tax=Centroberyx affinis TaxID=166261 RepID=UPI003A5C511C
MAHAFQIHDKASRLKEPLSCLLVGDGAVGKTSMIISYIFNGYPSEYRQTAFDVFSGLVHVNGIPTQIKLIDTAGQEEFDHFRSLCYAHVDVFILCFSVVNPVSFDNITAKWIPQIRAGNSTSPIILVGTQSDLRHSANILIHLDQLRTKPVHFSQARRLAHRIRADEYVECSALTQKSLKDVFDCAIFAAVKHNACKKSKDLKLLDRLKTFSNGGWKKLFCFI